MYIKKDQLVTNWLHYQTKGRGRGRSIFAILLTLTIAIGTQGLLFNKIENMDITLITNYDLRDCVFAILFSLNALVIINLLKMLKTLINLATTKIP